MRLLLTGSRTWVKQAPVRVLLRGFQDIFGDKLHVILGDEPNGLDNLATSLCKEYGIAHTVHRARWDELGRAAGPERNGRMVADKPDVSYAFRVEGVSRGTDNCIKQSVYAKVPTYVVREHAGFP